MHLSQSSLLSFFLVVRYDQPRSTAESQGIGDGSIKNSDSLFCFPLPITQVLSMFNKTSCSDKNWAFFLFEICFLLYNVFDERYAVRSVNAYGKNLNKGKKEKKKDVLEV